MESEWIFTSYSCLFCSQLMTKHPKVADQLWPNWASIRWSQPASASGDQSYSRVPRDNKRCLLLSFFFKNQLGCQISLKLHMALTLFNNSLSVSLSSRCVQDGRLPPFLAEKLVFRNALRITSEWSRGTRWCCTRWRVLCFGLSRWFSLTGNLHLVLTDQKPSAHYTW